VPDVRSGSSARVVGAMFGEPLLAHGTGVWFGPSSVRANEQYESRHTSGNHGEDEPAHFENLRIHYGSVRPSPFTEDCPLQPARSEPWQRLEDLWERQRRPAAEERAPQPPAA
jgi:hypothetical protein